jgi:isopentenyl phosphate kinase
MAVARTGHVAAARYGIHKGLTSDADWFGFAATSAAALRLNRLVVDALLAVDIPAWSLQPSTTVETANGQVVRLADRPHRAGA